MNSFVLEPRAAQTECRICNMQDSVITKSQQHTSNHIIRRFISGTILSAHVPHPCAYVTMRKHTQALNTHVQAIDILLKLFNVPPEKSERPAAKREMGEGGEGGSRVEGGAYMESSTIVSKPSLVL
jgi:hypothetical protein